MRGVLREFKEFAVRGNVIDLAVGVIIGGAFGKITTSLVNDVIMPFIGMLIGGVHFDDLTITLPNPFGAAEPNVIMIGNFINTVLDFIIIAFVVFLFVKFINRLRRLGEKKAEAPAPEPPKPSREEELLTEIRDLLAKREDGNG
jgi:large conductance mechanosensitive channel